MGPYARLWRKKKKKRSGTDYNTWLHCAWRSGRGVVVGDAYVAEGGVRRDPRGGQT